METARHEDGQTEICWTSMM